LYFFRKVTSTLCVEGAPFVRNIGLDRALLSFLYLCFSANLKYLQVMINAPLILVVLKMEPFGLML
jgi:hypothetical protein